jgi:hypothetical protein
VGEQSRVRAVRLNHLDGGLRVLGPVRQPVELAPHDLAPADRPVQHALIQDTPELRRARPL